MTNWYKVKGEGIVIRLWVQPGAKTSQVVGLHGDDNVRLKVKIAAPPLEGRANDEVVAFFKKRLKLPKSALTIVSGELSRAKDLLCQGISLEAVLDLLNAGS